MEPDEDFYPDEAPPQDASALQEADTYIRENPVPVVLGALALGFAIGMLVRAMERGRREETMRDRWEDAEDYMGSLFSPVAKKTKRAFRKSSSAVHDAFEEVADKVRDIDVEDYTDPVATWFGRWWRKCCG